MSAGGAGDKTLLKKLLREEERMADDLAIRCFMYIADCGFMQGGVEE